MTRVNQGLFSTTMEAEKRDPGNEVGLPYFVNYGAPGARGAPILDRKSF